MRVVAWISSVFLGAVAACTTSNAPQAYDPGSADASVDGAADGEAGAVAKGSRVFGAGLDFGDPSVYQDLADLNDAGGRTIDLSFAWNEVEQPFDAGPDADTDASTALFAPLLHAVNIVLPPAKTSLSLGAYAVDVGGSRLPEDLRGRPLDDPEVIRRYALLLAYVFEQLRDTSLDAILVADRVDFGEDLERWNAFTTFVTALQGKSERGVPIGFSISLEALERRHLAKGAVAAAGVVAVQWPWLDPATERIESVANVGADFDAVCQAAASAKKAQIVAVGQPSSGDPATFVTSLFGAWDRWATACPHLTFAFLDDPHAETVTAAAAREGRSGDPGFAAAFGSLGLRDAAGKPKPGFDALVRAARARGF